MTTIKNFQTGETITREFTENQLAEARRDGFRVLPKITGLKKAVGDFQRANAGGAYSARYGNLMYDRSTGKVWTDEFYDLGHGSWIDYHSADVIRIDNEIENVSMRTVRDYIENRFSA